MGTQNRAQKYAEAALAKVERVSAELAREYRARAENLPVMVLQSGLVQAVGFLRAKAAGDGEVGLYDVALDGPTAWLFGNEAHGLPDDLAALADHRVAIPIHGRAESLNLATAAALCLYESARHRTLPG